MEFRKPCAICRPVCAVESYQWCGEPCSAGAVISKDVSTENSKAGQAQVIIDLMSALWTVNLYAYAFTIKNYTEVFYTVYKRHVPSLQCKMSLDRSTSMREVDGFSPVFIDF